MTPVNFNYFVIDPSPSTVTLGIEVSIQNFGGDTIDEGTIKYGQRT